MGSSASADLNRGCRMSRIIEMKETMEEEEEKGEEKEEERDGPRMRFSLDGTFYSLVRSV